MLARSITFPPPLTIAEAFVVTAAATDTAANDLADKEALREDVWTLARSRHRRPAPRCGWGAASSVRPA